MKVWDRRASLPVVFEGHTGWVGRLWYRRDGRRVVTAAVGSFKVPGETTKGWDPETGELDPTLTGVEPDRLVDDYSAPSEFPFWVPPPPATSPDGRLLARALLGAGGHPEHNRSRGYAHSSVEVLDAATGHLLHTLIGHTADLVGIAFSPDGRRIATASLDRTIKLWDTATGREVFTLRGHTAGLLALAFSPDGRRIVSGAIDFTGRIWDATPLPAEILQAQEARHRQKRDAFAELARATEDFQRAESLARNGRWDLAAAAFGKYVEQEPNNPELRYPQIRSLAQAGDVVGVRNACRDLFKRFGRSSNSNSRVANSVAWSCVLTPDADLDPKGPLQVAEDVQIWLLADSRSVSFLTVGAALYRAGRFEEAIRRLDESIRATGGQGAPKAAAFLALAHHRLGHRDEARRWLDKLGSYQSKEGAESFWDEVEIRILRREAESLIRGSSPSAPTPAATEPTKKAFPDPRTKPE
jgi:tetratricopeptide (TPR) repeat protein